ncbi:MAG TPA: hypothetical protein VGJ06_14635 [Candidatus Acidoferrum sp.]
MAADEDRNNVEGYQSETNSCLQKRVDFQKFQEMVRNFAKYWLRSKQPPPLAAFVEPKPGAQP